VSTQHTPTPKIAIENVTKSARGMISGDLCVEDSGWNGERYLAELKDAHPDFAAFIVRACNSHDALVAALKSVRNDLRSFCGVVARSNGVHSAKAVAADKRYRDALAALAAAER
jgi:hypothetical protein